MSPQEVDSFTKPRIKRCDTDELELRKNTERKFGTKRFRYRLLLNKEAREIKEEDIQEAINRELFKEGFAVGLFAFTVNKCDVLYQIYTGPAPHLAARTEVTLWYYWYAP
jgi:hypothetical protein